MKIAIKNISNYLLSKSAARITCGLNVSETRLDSSASKTKTSALFVSTFLLMFLVLSMMSGAVKAASFTVNLNTDAADINQGNGICDTDSVTPGAQCTLRAAIQEANFFTGIDFITFSLQLPNTITFVNGGIEIQNSLSIEGPGARGLTIQRGAGANNYRVFTITGSNQNVTISGVTIANGTSEDDLVDGGRGGAIYLSGAALNLTGVNIGNNAAVTNGGGIYNVTGTLNITRSTIKNNQSGDSGGGIYNSGGTVNITNSTISGNTTGGNVFDYGGGVFNTNDGNFNTIGAVTLTNVTVSGNAANVAGGIRNSSSATFNVRNTIVAGNTDNSSYADSLGAFTTQGNNLIGVANPGSGFTDGINGDKTGFLGAPLDPMLGALQNNGGQTDTRALLAGSPAIDAGNNCVTLIFPQGCISTQLATDQRGVGFPRQIDGNNDGTATVDIGAFEAVLIPTAAEVTVGGRVLTATGRGISNVRVTMTFPNGETRAALSNAFGYYRFNDIPAGETYVISVSSKRYSFANNTRIINIAEDALDIDFIADAVVSKES